MMLNWCRVEEHTHFAQIARDDGVPPEDADLLPDTAEELDRLFYVPPGFGVRDLTPPHMRGATKTG